MINLINGEALEVMDELIKQGIKVDAVITDPPYGTTACKWDSVIPFEPMWERLNKLIKDNGAVVLFGSEPFSSALRMSNIKKYKYDWVWEKSNPSGFVNAKLMPIKSIENILIFSSGGVGNPSKNKMKYFPQNLIPFNKIVNQERTNNSIYSGKWDKKEHLQTFTNYPKQILKFPNNKNKTGHPTQKPVELMEYLIKTYTNEGEVVLDFTMGSGSTGVACKNLNRKFIGIELNKEYFDIAEDRII